MHERVHGVPLGRLSKVGAVAGREQQPRHEARHATAHGGHVWQQVAQLLVQRLEVVQGDGRAEQLGHRRQAYSRAHLVIMSPTRQ